MPPVTYLVANVNNTRGNRTIDMYQVVVVTKSGNQIDVPHVDELIGNWNEQIDPNSGTYNEGVDVYNAHLNDTLLLPGAKASSVLATDQTFSSVARVYVYPYGGFAHVEAKKI